MARLIIFLTLLTFALVPCVLADAEEGPVSTPANAGTELTSGEDGAAGGIASWDASGGETVSVTSEPLPYEGSPARRSYAFHRFISFIVLCMLFSVPLAITCHILAVEKGREKWTWTILALIPVFSSFFLIYAVGARNLILDNKLDRILARLESKDIE